MSGVLVCFAAIAAAALDPPPRQTYAFRAPVQATATVERDLDAGLVRIEVDQSMIQALPAAQAEQLGRRQAQTFAHRALFRFLGGAPGQTLILSEFQMDDCDMIDGRLRSRWRIATANCRLEQQPDAPAAGSGTPAPPFPSPEPLPREEAQPQEPLP